jgi:hypothetical protein
MGVPRTTLRAAAVLFVAGVAAAPIASAGPERARTTEPTNFAIFTVKLASAGVTFAPAAKAQSQTTGEFKIYNSSNKSRKFELAGRATKLLKPKAHTIFFLLLADPGTYIWRSFGPNARTFKGTFEVD